MKPQSEWSPALLVFMTTLRETKHKSWLRINGACQSAVFFAIKAGLSFDVGDLGAMLGANPHTPGDAENYYTAAVISGNMDAARSVEHYLKRKPIIPARDWPVERGELRRVRYGFKFWHPEVRDAVTVTSIGDGGEYVTACWYDGPDRYGQTPARRFKISRETFKQPYADFIGGGEE